MNIASFLQGDVGGGMSASLERTRFKLSPTSRAEFYEMMGSLIKDGKPLDASIRELHIRYEKKRRPLGLLLAAWSKAMAEGKLFATALTGYVAETELVIIAAAEKSGDLTAGFEQAALVARSSSQIRKTLAAELTTPAIQSLVLIFVLIGFSTTVAPQLTQSVPLWAMDDSQRALFGLSAFIASTWYVITPALAGLVYLALWSMPRYTGTFRPYLDKLPPWSIYRVYCSSTFMISLSALIRAGVPIETAIRFIKQQSSPWMAEHLAQMVRSLRSGVEQGEAMDTGLLSDRLSDMVAIYSRTADFDRAVSSVGKLSMEDGLTNIKGKAAMAKTVATLLIGVVVGWIFLAVMGISDAAQRANQQQQSVIQQSRVK